MSIMNGSIKIDDHACNLNMYIDEKKYVFDMLQEFVDTPGILEPRAKERYCGISILYEMIDICYKVVVCLKNKRSWDSPHCPPEHQ